MLNTYMTNPLCFYRFLAQRFPIEGARTEKRLLGVRKELANFTVDERCR